MATLQERLDEAEANNRVLRGILMGFVKQRWRHLYLRSRLRLVLGLLATGRAFTKTQILDALQEAFPRENDRGEGVVHLALVRLRKVLAALDPPIHIETIRGEGYRMDAENCALLAKLEFYPITRRVTAMEREKMARVSTDKAFFDAVRAAPFNGHLTADQVSGLNAILVAWNDKYAVNDIRWLAYGLATAFHETAGTMQPIEEYGKGKGHAYGHPDPETGKTYYGRGLVQLTWKYNYRTMETLTGKPLVAHPELALDMHTAILILFEGMIRGSFTGRRLATYFGLNNNRPAVARQIINGLDRADLVASYHEAFLKALHAVVMRGITTPT